MILAPRLLKSIVGFLGYGFGVYLLALRRYFVWVKKSVLKTGASQRLLPYVSFANAPFALDAKYLGLGTSHKFKDLCLR